MKEDIIARINELINTYSRSVREFANLIGVKQATLNQQLRGERGVSLDTVIAVMNAFPEVSSNWLITGKGEMMTADNLPHISGEETDGELELHAKLAQLAAEVDELKKDKFILEDRVKWLKDYNKEIITQFARGEDARKSIS
jgi:plasmid maintenance system antidote protein VapI